MEEKEEEGRFEGEMAVCCVPATRVCWEEPEEGIVVE